ncbi:MAG TPA: hypothetical protein VHE60_04450 [Pyrinomonadaceae bacterium]|nr:hypothetical protein [Pyrinomonadaceae bacterium]
MTERGISLRKRLPVSSLLAMALALLALVISSKSSAQKVKPEEVVARHLESIGSARERAAVTTRIIAGTSQVIFRTPPPGQATGRAVLASEGIKNLIGMSFPSPIYPREELGFNGNSFIAAYVTPGVRSSLGSFLMTHDLIFKQGLMGGTLSSAWPLLDLKARGAQLEYAGTKKVDNRTLHELKYMPHSGSDLKISLFFDQETFQHVRTEYERVIAAPTGDRGYLSGRGRETRYKMVEEFSEFRKEGGLTLPHTYRIKLIADTDSGAFLADWEITLTQFAFNEKIDPNSFSISSK